MDNFEMPDSAFKADKRETERDLSDLKKRVTNLEDKVRQLSLIILDFMKREGDKK